MASLPDLTFKDDTPQNTVARIKEILSIHGIETTEHWSESGVPRCHSLRVSVTGTPFGANGKGITRALALASGYGELMERLQLGYLVKSDWQKGSLLADGQTPDARMTPSELLQSSGKWLTIYASEARSATGAAMTEAQLLEQYTETDGRIPVTEYHCVSTGDQVYLPTALRRSVYTTNGCAAGNTMEEAMIQAISEIVERHYKGRILAEGIPVPEISKALLRACPIAWEIITFLRGNGFRVTVKDCSLGTKFPVVCVCLIDGKTGKYHTHFGAFPNFEIALQRTLTESFQGRTLEKIGQYEDFCPGKEDAQSLRYLMNELVRGTSEKTPEFFLNTAAPSAAIAGFSGSNNRALLKECLEFFGSQGYDVLVRDCSCLGFPTCQILIPGYSEIFPHRLSPKHSDMRYSAYAKKVLRHPAAARPDEIMGYLMHLTQNSEKNLSGSFLAEANLAAKLTAREEAYLLNVTMAHIHYTIGKTTEALKALDGALPLAPEPDAEYLICVKRYLTLGRQGYGKDEIHAILTFFHQPDTVQRMYQLLESKKNPLDPVTLHCEERCSPDCRLYTTCRQRSSAKLAAIINEKLRQLDQAPLRSLLQSL